MAKIYSLGIFGNTKAGKTILAESILFKSGMTDRMGKVEDGSTVMDYDEEEIKRLLSINIGFGYVKGKEDKIYLIDVPGYMDFAGEQIAGLNAADIAVLTISADEGVSAITEKMWSYLEQKEIPTVIFVNKLDLPDVSFDSLWKELEATFGTNLLLAAYPKKEGGNLTQVINLLEGKNHDSDIQEYVQKSMDAIVELDDALMEKYLEGTELSIEEISKYIKKGIIDKKIIPVITGSALHQIGIDELINFVRHYMPASDELGTVKAKTPEGEEKEVARTEDQPLTGIVAKVTYDPFAGKLSFLKVCSGKLTANSQILNSTRNVKERVGQLLRIQGKKQEQVDHALPGEIVGVAKLTDIQQGDSFCETGKNLSLISLPLPEGAVSYSIKPKVKGTEDKLGTAINRIDEEDPTINIHRDEETGETIISGMGDLHIDIAINKFKTKFGVEVEKGIPKIAYKETITQTGNAEGKYKKQTGGKGQFGHCFLKVEPLEKGAGFEFVDAIVGGSIPRQFIPSVEKGVRESMKRGITANYPIVDLKVTVYDGSYHTVDSSDVAFQVAASMALQKAFSQANPILLEPIVNIDISSPQDLVGDVIGTINAKRGKVLNMNTSGKNQLIKAQVPLAELANYTNELRSITSGQGTFTMAFSHYEMVPAHLSQKIIEERARDKEKTGQ